MHTITSSTLFDRIEETVDSLDEVLHFHEEEMEDAMRQDVVLGWERLSKGGWVWT